MSDFNGQKIQENIRTYQLPIYKVARQQLTEEQSLMVMDETLFHINSWPQIELQGEELEKVLWRFVLQQMNSFEN